jgi:hypothetical protein
VIGPASADLRGGPGGSFGVGGPPPYGVGSLQIIVPDGASKTTFGNEVDFFGDPVSGLTDVGFHVYVQGAATPSAVSMPGILFEIDPRGAGSTSATFSSLVWIPPPYTVANQWSGYLDATTTGTWGLTGAAFNSPATAANCGLNGPRCTWTQVQAFLATGAGATIYSATVSKGRDFAFYGAVDGLRINDTVYDFEPLGVVEVPAP